METLIQSNQHQSNALHVDERWFLALPLTGERFHHRFPIYYTESIEEINMVYADCIFQLAASSLSFMKLLYFALLLSNSSWMPLLIVPPSSTTI